MIETLLLVLIFELKHFIADYLLQVHYMLGKFKEKGWALPLASHCAVHAVFTFLISLLINPSAALLCATIDFVIHFGMDRLKASPKLLGRYKSLSKDRYEHFMNFKHLPRMQNEFRSNRFFWWSLGFDQLIHSVTGLLIVAILLGC